MKRLWLIAAVVSLCSTLPTAQSKEELTNDGKNSENVAHPEHGLRPQELQSAHANQRSNVKRLVPIWSTSLMNDAGELAAPTIYNGIMYVINGRWTFAIDVATGNQIVANAG